MRSRFTPLIILIVASWIAADWQAWAAGPFVDVVKRRTGDRDHDLINALLDRGQIDEAEAICKDSLQQVIPESDSGAKWAIRLSKVLTRRVFAGDKFDQVAIKTASAPVAELLRAYPDHRRQLFLQAQVIEVQRAAAKHQIVVLSVSPDDPQRSEAVLIELMQATRVLKQLKQDIGDARALLDTERTGLDAKSLSADLERQQHQIESDLVGISLLQTNLFPPGSRDQISAAVQAERAAEDALKTLPNNSVVRQEIDRMRIESIIRGNELDRARKNLDLFVRLVGTPTPVNVLAMQVHLDLRQNRNDQAGRRLAAYYQSNPKSAPRSIEMDLARLEHMIATNDTQVADWLESIEQRNGAYARRRAESISLARMRSDPDRKTIDPSMVAAQGEDWLRRGDTARAAQLLAAAASAEADPDRALGWAMKAGAAYTKANQIESASKVLADIAIRKPTAKNAAAAHLQAAVVLSSSKQPDIAKKLEALLVATHDRWPDSQAAASAQKWLLTLLDRQGRVREATETATSFLNDSSSQQSVDRALHRWATLIRDSKGDTTITLIGQFESAFAKLKATPAMADRYPLVAVYVLESNSLRGLPKQLSATNPKEKFADAVLAFRRTATVSTELQSAPDEVKSLAIWRLMRDAKQDAKMRRPVSDLLKSWGDDNIDQKAILMVWRGETKAAVDAVRKATSTDPKPSARWRSLANALSDTGKLADRQAAIDIWDRLSSGLPKGSSEWHEAKLAAIGLLMRNSQADEAIRRAKYILLTDRPSDAALLQRYETIKRNP